jgi:hypothetical protein
MVNHSGFVGDGKYAGQIVKSKVYIKSHNVLDCLLAIVAEDDSRSILVIDEELHGRGHHCSDGEDIWSVVYEHVVQKTVDCLAVSSSVGLERGAEEGALLDIILL